MNSNIKIKAVIFDLGRVLVDVNTQRLWEFFFEQYKPEDPQAALGQIMTDPIMRQYSTGQIGTVHFYSRLCENYHLNLSFDEFCLHWCSIFSPIDGMETIVKKLEGQVRLGLLSDTDPLHWDFIRANYPLMQYFPRPALSFLLGNVKPHPDVYLAAAKLVKTEPEECLFIDDLQKNVDGAKQAGMNSIRFEGVKMLQEYLNSIGL